MGRLLLAYDWASHPLGPLDTWAPPVRTMVATALSSRFPVVVWLGEPLYLVYNDGYIPMLGERHPSALGAAGADVWWDIWDVVGPMLDGVVRTGVATWSDDLNLNLMRAGRPEERYFTFTYSPIIGGDGSICGVFCPVTETTERVIGERRLHILNALGTAFMDAQSEDDVLRATVEAGPFPAVPFAGVYLDEGVPGDRRRLGAASPGSHLPDSLSADTSGEAQHLDVDGRPAVAIGLANMTLLLGLNPLRPFDEQYRSFCRLFAGQVSAAFDSARAYEFERRRAETLAELDRAKTEFLTNVSHEFRTPLTLLLGPLEDALHDDDGTPPELRERLGTAYRNGLRLSRLVNSLLDFSRVEAGEARPQLVETDVGALTAQIASSFAEVCALAGIDLVSRCASVMGRVDPDMWETVVLNLVSNAFKFTLAGSITVTAAPSAGEADDQITVTVSDTGVGIAAEDLPHLFDRFYRARPSGARSVEGSGIGLALVRSLVAAQGGMIGVQSEVGTGTTVKVTLPAARTTAAAPRPAAPIRSAAYVSEAMQWVGADTDPAPSHGERPLILVADDKADMRRHLVAILSTHWPTVAVADGEAALESAKRLHPDLLLTDVMMPTLDGFGLAAAIRKDPELGSLPVVMLSARAGAEASGEGWAAGAEDYLVKPFRSADLISRVAARLEATERARASGARRAYALAELGAALSAATTLDAVLDAVLASPLGSVHSTGVAIALTDSAAGLARVRYTGALPPELVDRYHVIALDAPIPIVDAITTGQRIVIEDIAGLDARYGTVVADARPLVRACVIEPLRGVDGSVTGAISFNWPEPRTFDETELATLRRTAELVASASERIRFAEREHRVATELQERLLDLDVRSLTAAVSAAYQPATETMRVGGDWYTATTLDGSGRLAVSVGDVVGNGLAAATVMSQLRSALGAAALTTPDPRAVIDLVERYAETVDGATCATVAYAVVDAQAGNLTYACAGHPYPLLVTADGDARFLRDGRRPPLGAGNPTGGGPAPNGKAAFPPGSLLVLYTDGLVERHDEVLDVGLDRLAVAARACACLPTGAACEELLRRLAPQGGYSDDVALVAVRPVGTTGTSHVDVRPADVAEAAGVRARLRAWLEGLGLERERVQDALVAVGEALNNAIEHGSA